MKNDSEKAIENSVIKWLNLQPGVFAFKVATAGVYDARRRFYRKADPNIVLGTADVLGVVTVDGIGVFCSWEIKTAKGVQSDHQKKYEALVSQNHGFYFLIRSIEDANRSIQIIRKVTWARLASSHPAVLEAVRVTSSLASQ